MKYTTYREYLKKSTLTEEELRKRTGISQQYMSAWKHKHYNPSIKKLLPIAKELNIPLDELVK